MLLVLITFFVLLVIGMPIGYVLGLSGFTRIIIH